ncbi:protein kinase domain-containing protein [Allokutzneria albata]|uniref:Serine/threonine protein kinase n=1 Tax=Allokutzneria albata TaxID=211114 RepID=A0A1G9T7U0_ALLAB|nr:hypothetical protein [Allokutzneria albata]SDM43692.1 Serine/threonine protein kinase [Allokutzneria albata]
MSDTDGALPTGFEVVELIDEDPVATTYLVRGPRRDAVLTVARSRVADEERAECLRWADALTIAAASPNIADVISAGLTHDGRPHLVCATGETLSARICDSRALSLWTAQAYGVGIADALAAAHAAGLSHGAVQPGTVLVIDDGAVLAGFGTTAPGLTAPGVVDVYTAPEHIAAVSAGRVEASEAGDIYSLGVTLYVVLGGTVPWQDAPMDLALRSEQLPGLPDVSVELLDLLRAAVSVDDAARPTAEQLRDWLIGLDLAEVDRARPVAPSLLGGRGSARVGKRSAVLITAISGTLGVVGGVTSAGGTGTSAGAVTTATTGGRAVTKVVVVSVVVAAVGVGGGYVGKQIYDDATCDNVVADKQSAQVLSDGADLVDQAGYEFTLRLGERITTSGAADPSAKEVRFSLPANEEGRLVGGKFYAGRADKWAEVDPASDKGKLLAAAAAPIEAVKAVLPRVATINRNGCDFDGTLTREGKQPIPFTASVEKDRGRLVSFASGEVEARFSNFEVPVDVPAPSVAPKTVQGIWEQKREGGYVNRLLVNNSFVRIVPISPSGGDDVASGCIKQGQTDPAVPSLQVTLECPPDLSPGRLAAVTIRVVGDREVVVDGVRTLSGTYALVQR